MFGSTLTEQPSGPLFGPSLLPRWGGSVPGSRAALPRTPLRFLLLPAGLGAPGRAPWTPRQLQLADPCRRDPCRRPPDLLTIVLEHPVTAVLGQADPDHRTGVGPAHAQAVVVQGHRPPAIDLAPDHVACQALQSRVQVLADFLPPPQSVAAPGMAQRRVDLPATGTVPEGEALTLNMVLLVQAPLQLLRRVAQPRLGPRLSGARPPSRPP
jgi:hypothetical protein